MSKSYKFFTTLTVVAMTLCSLAFSAAADPMTLPDAQAVFPAYDMSQQDPEFFQTPCVDADGTMTITANVGDITDDAIAVAMVCQAVGYPPFQDGGTVSFDVPGAFLISFMTVPGFPDAFALEFGIPLGTEVINITITDTGWPEGCVPVEDFLDFAGFEDLSVPTKAMSWGEVKALF